MKDNMDNKTVVVPDDLADIVSKAMRRAWQLGQTFWRQADSESYSQNAKSRDTEAKFDQLIEETRTAVLSANQQEPDEYQFREVIDLAGVPTWQPWTNVSKEKFAEIRSYIESGYHVYQTRKLYASSAASLAQQDEREADCYGIRYIDPADGEVSWDHCWTERWAANQRINDMIQRYVDEDMAPPAFELVPLLEARAALTAPQDAQFRTAHSLAGFRGGFIGVHGRAPTEQEIWNAGVRSGLVRSAEAVLQATTAQPADANLRLADKPEADKENG